MVKMHSQRQRRVAKLVQSLVSDILRDEVDDPSIGFLTITGAEVSPDLRHAMVYYSVLGSERQVEATTDGLRRARKFINVLLGERLETKYTPSLQFRLDETPREAQKIERTLKQIEDQLGPEIDGDEPADESADVD